MTLEILFEDNHLLCCNKPAGIPTQPSPEGGQNLESMVKAFIKARDHKPGNVYLHAVHRLDKPASGIVIFAKTHKALSRMQELFRKREVTKIYHALIEGSMPKNEASITLLLTHGSHKAHVGEGQESTLTYKVIEKKGDLQLLEIELTTGRYHQIRASLAHIGFPIVGDTKYGSLRSFAPGAIALHHYKVAFIHPIRKEPLTVIVNNLNFKEAFANASKVKDDLCAL